MCYTACVSFAGDLTQACAKKRVRIDARRTYGVLSALARAQGLSIASDEADLADLLVKEVSTVDEVRRARNGAPLVVLADRRLKSVELQAFIEAGAMVVIDAESSVLDVAFGFSELLFSTRVQQRRYCRAHGGVPVRFFSLGSRHEPTLAGRLVEIARPGAFILTEHRLPEGTSIDMGIRLHDRAVSLRGRVVFVASHEDRGGIAVEFALDHDDVAPRLFSLCHDVDTRMPSGDLPMQSLAANARSR